MTSLDCLARLIEPIDAQTFLREHYERAPLYIPRDDPRHYSGLLGLADVDHILSHSHIRDGELRVVLDGKPTRISSLKKGGGNSSHNALEEIYEQHRNGATLVLNSLQIRWPPLREFANELGAILNARIQVNVYVTPAGNQGFAPHYDTHDVFIAQVHGSKRWRLHGQTVDLPLASQPHDKSAQVPDVTREIDLANGDLLYLPRGSIHAATANDGTSVHLTIGIHPYLWSQVIERAIKRAFTGDVRFRRVLPPGDPASPDWRDTVTTVFQQYVAALAGSLPADEMLEDVTHRLMSINQPTLSGHLTDIDRLTGVGLDTPVTCRPMQRCRPTSTGSQITLDFHNKSMTVPAVVAGEIDYVLSSPGKAFTGRDLPGDLDDASRVEFIKVLIREGLLTLAGE